MNSIAILLEKRGASLRTCYLLEGERSPSRYPERASIFYHTLQKYWQIEIIRLNNLEDLPPSTKSLVFVNFGGQDYVNYPAQQVPILKQKKMLPRTVLVNIDDGPIPPNIMTREAAAVSLTVTMKKEMQKNKRLIAGYGFIPHIPEMSITPFDHKEHIFHFRGTLNGIPRCKFLRHLRTLNIPTSFSCRLPETPPDWMKAGDLLGTFDELYINHLCYADYFAEMNRRKFCLAPLGWGPTYRFLEGMAIGCLVITDTINHLAFSVDVFQDGRNYLETGPELENVERRKDN